ncbi:MAG: hypothetical protein QM742_12835 [Aquabacterium sp.]
MPTRRRRPRPLPRRQEGIVLLVAIIVMVALTLASLALMRSVYTSNVIAGNLAFQRAATHSSEAGLERAVAWLECMNGRVPNPDICATNPTALNTDVAASGYLATRKPDPVDRDWNKHWGDNFEAQAWTLTDKDGAGNRVRYVIERMCKTTGDPDAVETACTVSPNPGVGTCTGGSSCGAGNVNLASPQPVYYRITVRVDGPRNTQSLVQAMVAI